MQYTTYIARSCMQRKSCA